MFSYFIFTLNDSLISPPFLSFRSHFLLHIYVMFLPFHCCFISLLNFTKHLSVRWISRQSIIYRKSLDPIPKLVSSLGDIAYLVVIFWDGHINRFWDPICRLSILEFASIYILNPSSLNNINIWFIRNSISFLIVFVMRINP